MKQLIGFFRSNLRGRLIALLLPLVALPIIITGAVLLTTTTNERIEVAEQAERARLEADLNTLNARLREFDQDIIFLAESANVQALAQALLAEDDAAIATARQRLTTDFAALADSLKVYDQVRFIGVNGDEIVRVNYDPVTDEVAVVSDENLQNKADRGYFTGTINQPEGGLYISPLNLNREGSPPQIEVLDDGSLVPVLRYGKPVYVDDPASGARRLGGIVVANTFADPILNAIQPAAGDAFLMNADGYFLANTAQPEITFGFEAGIEETLSGRVVGEAARLDATFPENDEALLAASSQPRTLRPEGNLLVNYARVAPPGAPPDYYWVLGLVRDETVLFAEAQQQALVGALAVGGIVLVAGVLIASFAGQIAQPVTRLAQSAQSLASGNFQADIDENMVRREDEIGALGRAFTAMSTQLSELVGELERRVAARTADLETSADIARAANQVRELEDLLSLAVNLVRDRFNFYYVQVYLTDDKGEFATLKEGTGYVGRRLLTQGHRLPLDGTSLVAKAINTAQPVVVQDTHTDPSFLPNELLPDTRSELAMPLRSQAGVIGVLDIQHNVAQAFDDNAVNLFGTLAEQLAVTFENVRLFEDVDQRAREMQTVSEVSLQASSNLNLSDMMRKVCNLTRDSFNLYHAHIYLLNEDGQSLDLAAGAGEPGLLMVEAGYSIPLDQEHSLVARAARDKEGVIANDVRAEPDFLPNDLLPETRSEMAIPMLFGETLVGVLDVQATTLDRFTDEDVRVKTTLAAQVAASVQNARSFEALERARQETARVFETSLDMMGSADYNGYFVSLNEAWTRTLGWTQEELKAKPFIEFVHPDDVQHTQEEAARNFGGSTSFEFENRYQAKDGSYRWISWTAFSDTEAELIHFVARDITQQKATEAAIRESAARLETVTRNFPNGWIVLYDQDLRYLLADGLGLEEALGRSREELEGKTVWEVFDGATAEEFAQESESALKGESTSQEVRINDRWFLTTNHPVRDENGAVVAGLRIAQDINERKIAEIINERQLQLTASLNAATSPQGILDAVVAVLVDHQPASAILYDVSSDDYNEPAVLTVGAAWAQEGIRASEIGDSFRVRDLPAVRRWFEQENAPTVYEDIENDRRLDEASREIYRSFYTQASVILPMFTGGRWIGLVLLTWPEPQTFSGDDTRLFALVTDRARVSLDSVQATQATQRALAESRKRADELAVVAEVSSQAATTLDVNQLLIDVSELTKERFNLYHAHIYLLSDDGQRLNLAAGAGEPGRIMVAQGRTIPYERPDSLVAQAARERRGVIVNDVTDDPNFLPNELLPETRSEMAIPMLVGETLVGVLDVQGDVVGRFTQEDVQIKTTLANQIAVAIQNARSFEAAQKRATEMAIVADVGTEVSTILDTEELVRDIAETTAQRFSLYHIHIYVMDAKGANLRLVAGTGRQGCAHVGTGYNLNVKRDEHPVTQSVRRRRGFINNDVMNDPRYVEDPNLPETRSQIAIPMVSGGEVRGVLEAHSDTAQGFTDDDIQTYTILATQMAIAIQNAQSFEASQRRAEELAIVANVSAQATRTLNLNELLLNVSELTKEQFDLYHAHIYLLSEDGQSLNLTAGAGEPGRIMVQQGHSIPANRRDSLVAQAARERRGVTVNDVTDNPNFLANPLLPDTRAEMALPMLVGDRVVGVLDVQATDVGHFTADDIAIKTTLANQIAVAVQNLRSFQQAERRAASLATVSSVSAEVSAILDPDRLVTDIAELTAQRFDLYHIHIYLTDPSGTFLDLVAGTGQAGCKHVGTGYALHIQRDEGPVTQAARERQGIINNDVLHDPDYAENPNLPETRSQIAIPMIVGAQLIGVVEAHADRVGGFNEEDVRIQSILAGQLAIAVANARTYAASQQRADELTIVADVGTRAAALLEEEGLLEEAVNTTQQRFELYHAQVYLLSDDGAWLELAAGSGEKGRLMREHGHRIPVGRENSLVARAARSRQGVIANDVTTELDFLPNPLLPDTRSELALPLIVGDRVLGVLDMQAETINRFDAEDVLIKTTLANQIAVALQNARSFEQAALRAANLETVARVSTATTTLLSVDELLETVVDLTKESFALYHAHIYLYDEESETLVLGAGAGDAGATMRAMKHAIPIKNSQSIVVRTATLRRGVIVNDVTSGEDYLPNPLLPDTRSEMAVPMIVGNEVIGVMDVQSTQAGRFTDEDLRLYTILAEQIAVAVRNAQAFERERRTVERLREVDRLKQEFLANMSHELRTPLNSIIGYSEVMLDGVDGELTEDAVEDVEAIYDSGKHLLNIINEILDLAKIEAGQMQLELKRLQLSEVLDDVVKAGQILVKDRDVEMRLVEANPVPEIEADPVRLRQIMTNLVSNAVKFTQEGTITLTYGMQDANNAVIQVEDTGMGMDEDALAIIFERFRQADGSSTRRAGGTGLGLTITRQLVNMHGGEIYVDSQVGEGSTFWFTLPINVPQDDAKPQQDPLTREMRPELGSD